MCHTTQTFIEVQYPCQIWSISTGKWGVTVMLCISSALCGSVCMSQRTSQRHKQADRATPVWQVPASHVGILEAQISSREGRS